MRAHAAFILVLAISVILLPVLPFPSTAAASPGPQVRVTASHLNLRDQPNTAGRVLVSLPRGALLVRLEEREGWIRARSEAGVEGWVSATYVEAVPTAGPEIESPTAPPPEPAPPLRVEPAPANRGGGSLVGGLLKWGCLAGAGVAGYLAYDEHGAGNDAYDEYRTLAHAGDAAGAEVKYSETEDHDGRSRTYMIVAGALAGAFLAQEFLLGGGSRDEAGLVPRTPVLFGWDPGRGEVRATFNLGRF